jgi:hypothetical protein
MNNAQAGPSKRRLTLPESREVIDLTVSDDDDNDNTSFPPPPQKHRLAQRRGSIVGMTREEVNGQHLAKHGTVEKKRDSDRKAEKEKGKGKQVDRDLLREAGGLEQLGWKRKGSTTFEPGRSIISNNATTSNMPKRSQTSAHPSHGLPVIRESMSNRNTHLAASASKQDKQRPSHQSSSTSPQKQARPIAGSSRVASHNNNLPPKKTNSYNIFGSSNTKPSAVASGSGRSATTAGVPGLSKSTSTTHLLAKPITSNQSDASVETIGAYQKRVSLGSTFAPPASSSRSISPIKASNSTGHGSGLVPGPREKGKEREKEKGKDEKGKEKEREKEKEKEKEREKEKKKGKGKEQEKQVIPEQRGRTEKSTEDRGIKRNRSAAFGSAGKPEPTPGMKVGRQRDLNSSAEVSRILSPGKSLNTPQPNYPIGRELKRANSFGRGTPTPAGKVLPPALQAGGHPRKESLLKESMSSRNLASRSSQSMSQPTQGEASATPPRKSTSPIKQLPSTNKPPVLPSVSGTNTARREALMNNRWRLKPSPGKSALAPVISNEETSKDPSYKTHRKSTTQAEKVEGEENEEPEEDIPSRPKRARPATGTYTVPSMDDPNWPTRNGSSGNETGARRRQRKSELWKAKTEAATQVSKGKGVDDNSDARTVVTVSSTHKSASPEKRGSLLSQSSRTLSHPRNGKSGSASTIAGPSKIEPTTPQTRHQRLSSQTPRTLSKQSIKSNRSLLKTASRRDRPPTLDAQTPHDGPDEDEEPIENRPPTPAKGSQDQEDDVVCNVFSLLDLMADSSWRCLLNTTLSQPVLNKV